MSVCSISRLRSAGALGMVIVLMALPALFAGTLIGDPGLVDNVQDAVIFSPGEQTLT